MNSSSRFVESGMGRLFARHQSLDLVPMSLMNSVDTNEHFGDERSSSDPAIRCSE